MTEEHQQDLIKLGHLLIDDVEANLNHIFDSIKRKEQIEKAETNLQKHTTIVK